MLKPTCAELWSLRRCNRASTSAAATDMRQSWAGERCRGVHEAKEESTSSVVSVPSRDQPRELYIGAGKCFMASKLV